ncbi:MAG: O-acetyl-ADP-ribose deacetylase, partial [Nitrososphaeria archaeon]|nr:O-acetyl-ADP-ribose deacetylase [Nitrososphaeria archaeon]NIN53583.1 O-acetyl-ADP-ribose deacetylase [Nitrososphaeria archaeon]NIQ34104.1 O-acetyl-ADP-ribose deacetylase [Nitrososphaeria archaeon]
MEVLVKETFIELVKGDITELSTDAVVNAANTALKLGGGVAGAIRRKGGPMIQEECDRIGVTKVGGAVITTAGQLKTRYVIHAVGPRYGEGDEEEKLRSATLNSLILAEENSLRSIAFPAISTGVFGFPKDKCAEVMLSATLSYVEGDTSLERIVICLYDSETHHIFKEILKEK